MHGRVKVRSSAEQEEAKKKEKAEKVRLYREITERLYEKRRSGDRDDEALKLTRNVLTQNPEITTFWNYRREIFLERFETQSPEEFSLLCDGELSLLEHCLKVNPKAYCVWHHREWILTQRRDPDWKKEKSLCDLFLKYDERNFHCWDYRRFVVSKSPDITPQDEFEFTYQKIATNFSNYSSWHYRSKLLPILHPHDDEPGCVAEEALLKEHELVQNAFFTDPSDQSAWFYQRWLLGKVDRPLAISCVFFRSVPEPIVYVTFNQPVKVTKFHPIKITIGDAPTINIYEEDMDWPKTFHACCSISNGAVTIGKETDIDVTVDYDHLQANLTLKGGEVEVWWLSQVDKIFQSSLAPATSAVLESELSSCQELMDLEPDNKWCIITVVLLMQATNAQKYASKITEMLKKLAEVDPYRNNYYADLLSKFVMEQILKEKLEGISTSNRMVDLSNKELSRLYFPEYLQLYKSVDLSRNLLSSLPDNILYLVSVSHLNLSNNLLETLQPELCELESLVSLSLENNKFTDLHSLECLSGLKQLEVLCLSGNPFVKEKEDEEQISKDVKSILPQLTKLNL